MKDIKISKMGEHLRTYTELTSNELPKFYYPVKYYKEDEEENELLTDDEVRNLGIFSAVLEEDDSADDVINLTKIVASSPNIHMIIYEYDNITMETCRRLIREIELILNDSPSYDRKNLREQGIDVVQPGYSPELSIYDDFYPECHMVFSRYPEQYEKD